MQSLVDYCMCPDWGLNLQPWCIRGCPNLLSYLAIAYSIRLNECDVFVCYSVTNVEYPRAIPPPQGFLTPTHLCSQLLLWGCSGHWGFHFGYKGPGLGGSGRGCGCLGSQALPLRMRSSRGWSLEGPCSPPHAPPASLRVKIGGIKFGQAEGRRPQVKWTYTEAASMPVGAGEG